LILRKQYVESALVVLSSVLKSAVHGIRFARFDESIMKYP
jgi:hypothetical protein